ncbi:MAG: hypothetical protein JWQ98_2974 [Chlorobi bacterium]|nr:hypothetical protein [Chlorobiota bacterium]
MKSIGIYGGAFLLSALVLSSCGSSRGAGNSRNPEQGSPEWIIQMYFTRRAFPEVEHYTIGELRNDNHATAGSGLSDSARVTWRNLQEDPTRAVYAVATTDRSYHSDTYAFFVRAGDGWKLNAIRTLGLPGVFYRVMQQLEGEVNLPDSLASRLANMRLAVNSDDSLRSYFRANAEEFDMLRNILGSTPDIIAVTSNGEADPAITSNSGTIFRITALLRKLRIHSIRRAAEGSGAFYLTIHNESDHAVGYLSLPEGAAPPGMTPSRFIYVEEIVRGWYIYKSI